MQEGHFLSTTDARAALDGAAKPVQPVVIARPSAADPRRQVRYEVVDKAPSTGSERWERVVAVVCLGKKWQFRGYPFKVRGFSALFFLSGGAAARPCAQARLLDALSARCCCVRGPA